MKGAMGMMGLCARAGRLISGEQMALKAIRSGKVYLALIDAGASANAKKAIIDACTSHQVDWFEVSEGQLGGAIGKPERMVAGITDRGFAEQLKIRLESN